MLQKEIDLPFWAEFRNVTKSAKKDVLLFAEIFGDTSLWLQGDKFDSPMNYSFRELMNDYFAHTDITAKEFAEGLVGFLGLCPWKPKSFGVVTMPSPK